MSDQLLDQLVDRPKYSSDKEFVEGILDEIFAKYEKVNNLKISLSTDNTFKAAATTVGAAKKAQDDLSLSVTSYNKLLTQTAQNQAKFNANTSEAAKDAATARVALAAQNAELTANAKAQLAANGSINEAKALVAALIVQRNQLNASDVKEKQQIIDLNEAIDQQNAFINENSSALEKRKINIGNYIGAINILKPALEQASAALQSLDQKSADNANAFQQIKEDVKQANDALAGLTREGINAGARFDALSLRASIANEKLTEMAQQAKADASAQQDLQKEIGLLTQVIDKQDAGFKTLNAELRANQQALQALRAAGLEGTEAFEKLRTEVNKAQDEFNDFKDAQKLLGKGEALAGIEGTIKALQGLAGVYGAATAAQSLLGDNDKELQENMAKLQAVMTLLISIQQVANAVDEAEAIIVGIQTGARAALSAATTVYTFVTEAATAATVAFRSAIALTGIGGIILLLASFVNELIKAANGANSAREAQAKYNDTLADFYAILSKNNDTYLKYQELGKKALEDQLALLTAQGAGYRELQAVKLALAAEDLKNSKDGLDNLGLTQRDVEQLTDQYDRLGTELQAYEQIRADAAKKAADAGDDPTKDRGVIRAESFIKSLNASRSALLAQIEPAQKQIDLNKAAALSQKTLTEELAKYNKEQRANLTLDTEKNRLQEIIDTNAAIVANEKKTEVDRVAAIQAGANAEKELAQANLARTLATPGLSKEERLAAIQDEKAEELKIDTKAALDTYLLTRQYDEAIYQNRLTVLKQQAQDQADADQAIVSNEKATFDKRIAANTDNYNKLRQIATSDYFNAIHDLSSDDYAGRAAAEEKFNSTILGLDKTFSANRRTIFADNAAKLLQDGINANQKIANNLKQQYVTASIALANSKASNHLSDEQYARQQQALDEQNAENEAQLAVNTAFLKTNATKEGTEERLAAETDLNDKVQALRLLDLHNTQDAEKRKQAAALETVNKISSAYGEVTGVISSFLDAQVTAQKNAIQSQIEQTDLNKQKQIDAENVTLDSAQDKAAKIAVINQRASDQDQQLKLKQKQMDIEKAQFDKIVAEGNIILNTAKAVAADLTQPWKIPFDIAIGAAQLAIAIAAPVPTYAEGTDWHIGGGMIVGDGGRSELVEMPDGRMYITPNRDTYMTAPAGTIVHPDADKFLNDIPTSVVYSARDQSNNQLEQVFVRGMGKVVQAIENKQELHIQPGYNTLVGLHKFGNSQVEYYNNNIQFKL